MQRVARSSLAAASCINAVSLNDSPCSFPAICSYGQKDRETGERKKVTGEMDQGGHQATAHAEADTSDEPDISRVHAGLHFPGG